MFTSSGWELLLAIIANILVPVLPGILFLWLCFGTKFKWVLLYILGRFIGVWVVAQSLFNLQFVRFWVWMGEYIIVLALLVVLLAIKLFLHKWPLLYEYINSLRIYIEKHDLTLGYHKLLPVYKFLTRVMGVVIVWFLTTSFLFTVSAPTYGDDSFSNWNRPIVNIIHDGWVTLWWDKKEILGRWTLWYPINIAIYKAVIADFTWGFNDYYTDLFQWFALLFCFIFIFTFTRDKTKNVFFSLIPLMLLTSLPLVFLHAVESYHDLPVTIYAVLAARAIYNFLTSRELPYLTIGLLISYLMTNIKIEWLVIYAAGIFITAFAYIIFDHKLRKYVLDALKSGWGWIRWNIALLLFFFIPFQAVRMAHGLWLNPSSIQDGEVLDKTIHREIFDTFRSLFLKQDNYGIVLIPLFLVVLRLFWLHRQRKYLPMYFFWVSIFLFVLFTLVFLFTNNFQWFLTQTTVNRVYTMSFFMFFAFIWLYLHERETK